METKDLDGIAVSVQEHTRTYTFPGGDTVTLKDVEQLTIRPSGVHRLQTKDGKYHVVPPTWIHIELELPEGWTI